MGNIPSDKNREGSELPRGLSWREWILLGCVMLFMLYYGIDVIVTQQAYADREFSGGPVTLDPVSAWFMGLLISAHQQLHLAAAHAYNGI